MTMLKKLNLWQRRILYPIKKKPHSASHRAESKQPVIVQVIQPESKQPQITNIIAGIAAFISLVLGIITYSLFLKSSAQTKAALRADTIAYNSYKSSDSISKVNAALNKQTLDETIANNKAASIEADKRDKRDSLNLSASIASLKETQKEFEVSHKPYLQVGIFDTVKMISGSIPVFSYYVGNIGSQPAKTLQNVYMIEMDTPNIKNYNKIKSMLPIEKNPFDLFVMYVNIGAPQLEIVTTNRSITQEQVTAIKTGKNNLYIRGEIIYINLANGKKMKFEYAAEFSVFNNKNWRMIYNENTPFK